MGVSDPSVGADDEVGDRRRREIQAQVSEVAVAAFVRCVPMARITIDELLAAARRRLDRLDPEAAEAAARNGATLIDIRSDSQIAHDGTIPDALLIQRNVLEWRLDPSSDHRDPRAPGLGDRVIVVCNEGYASSFAAETLLELGFSRATDLDGGFQAWREAGLPVKPPAG